MRTKLIYLFTIVAVTAFAIVFSQVDVDKGGKRYIQHREETYPKTKAPKKEFVTHLPIVSIEKEEDEECKVKTFYQSGKWNTLEDEPSIEGRGMIRIRGNSSKHFDKKSYLLKFLDEKGDEGKEAFLGMEKAGEWVLHGPLLDRTLMRNYICYNIAGQVMEYAPDVKYCELFLNGEYKGVYLAVESITRDEGRIELTKAKENQAVTSWIIRMDRDGKGDVPIENFAYYTYEMGVSGVDLKYPGKDSVNSLHLQFVKEELSEIERAIHSTERRDPIKGYKAYLNVPEFARYFVLNEFFGNVDAGRFSTYYYKNARGKVAPVVWDFNNGCDNYIDYVYDDYGFNVTQSPWFGQLMKDPYFVEEILKQYRILRKTVLSDAYIEQLIDETTEYLQDARKRNYEVYGYLFDLSETDTFNYLNPVERNYTSYEDAVKQMKGWLKKRGAWLDQHIDSLLQYCQDSKIVTEILE